MYSEHCNLSEESNTVLEDYFNSRFGSGKLLMDLASTVILGFGSHRSHDNSFRKLFI
jgi:hypothetical protein